MRETGRETMRKMVRRSISREMRPLERKMARPDNKRLMTERPKSVTTLSREKRVTFMTSVVRRIIDRGKDANHDGYSIAERLAKPSEGQREDDSH